MYDIETTKRHCIARQLEAQRESEYAAIHVIAAATYRADGLVRAARLHLARMAQDNAAMAHEDVRVRLERLIGVSSEAREYGAL